MFERLSSSYCATLICAFFLESWDGTVEGDDLLKKQDEAEKRLDEYLVGGKAETVKIHSILPEWRKSENPHFKAKAMQQSPLDIVLKKKEVAHGFCAGPHICFYFCVSEITLTFTSVCLFFNVISV